MQRLIEIPSVSSVQPTLDMSNLAVINELASWAESLGFRSEVLPIAGKPGKANLIATLGQGSGGLVLSGHTDTVPYDQSRWNFDPFKLTESDNRYYGLGSTDMKLFLALALAAAQNFSADKLKKPLILLATADEESSMGGARALRDIGKPKADCVIIGEPTGLKPVRAHKGVMMERIRLLGKSGHSSNPALGVSALEGMHKVMGELLAVRKDLALQQNPAFAVPTATLNLGRIEGGDNPNRICGECELSFDLRPLPGMDIPELRGQLHQRIQQCLQNSRLEVQFESLFDGLPAMETPANAEIVRTAEQLTGEEAGTVAFGTEAPYFQQMGMDVVILGPGSIDQAHQPDEYIEMSMLDPMSKMLGQFIHKFCAQ